jgi:hypothetical protein
MAKRTVVVVEVRYNSPAGVVLQRGEFYLRGKSPKQIALEWIQQIKREVYFDGLVSVIADNQDITEKVMELEKPLLD